MKLCSPIVHHLLWGSWILHPMGNQNRNIIQGAHAWRLSPAHMLREEVKRLRDWEDDWDIPSPASVVSCCGCKGAIQCQVVGKLTAHMLREGEGTWTNYACRGHWTSRRLDFSYARYAMWSSQYKIYTLVSSFPGQQQCFILSCVLLRFRAQYSASDWAL